MAGAAGLLFVPVLRSRFARDPFAVGNLRFVRGKPHLELGLGAMQGNIDVLVSHPLQDGLMSDGIVLPVERHILFDQASKGRGDLRGICLGLGCDGHAVQGGREFRFFDGQRVVLVAEGIAGCRGS